MGDTIVLEGGENFSRMSVVASTSSNTIGCSFSIGVNGESVENAHVVGNITANRDYNWNILSTKTSSFDVFFEEYNNYLFIRGYGFTQGSSFGYYVPTRGSIDGIKLGGITKIQVFPVSGSTVLSNILINKITLYR